MSTLAAYHGALAKRSVEDLAMLRERAVMHVNLIDMEIRARDLDMQEQNSFYDKNPDLLEVKPAEKKSSTKQKHQRRSWETIFAAVKSLVDSGTSTNKALQTAIGYYPSTDQRENYNKWLKQHKPAAANSKYMKRTRPMTTMDEAEE